MCICWASTYQYNHNIKIEVLYLKVETENGSFLRNEKEKVLFLI